MMNIISAGLHRSGSTWLFNVLRLIFLETNQEIYSCFMPFDQAQFKSNNIVKIHKYHPSALNFADFIFLTKRDLRDIAASAVRRKLIPLKLEAIIDYLTEVVNKEYLPWKPFIDLEIEYEKLIKNKRSYIALIGEKLNQKLTRPLINTIYTKVETMSKNVKVFDPISQLHPNHITDGGIGTFVRTLPHDMVVAIEKEFPNVHLRPKKDT